MTSSVDPDQTAPVGAVCSGSALFAKACVSENLGSLWYVSTTAHCRDYTVSLACSQFLVVFAEQSQNYGPLP